VPGRDLGLLLFFIGSLPVCFVRPFYGILLWTIVAFLNPQSYIWGAASFFPWAEAVAIPTLAGFLLFCRGWPSRLSSREVYLMLVLWVWFTITSIISTHTPLFMHHASDTWYRWLFVSKVLLMVAVTIASVDSFARLRILVLTIAGSFGFYVAKSFPFIIMTGGAYRLYGPENSMIADNNDFGLALNMTLPLFFFLAQCESNRWVKRLFGFLFLITIPAVFFTYSRGALVGLFTVSCLMFLRLQMRQRLLLVPVILAGVLVALLFAPEKWRDRMDFTNPDRVVDNSARERLNAWAFARHLAADYPIAGGGFGTFTETLFAEYAPDATDIHGAHSIYFGLLAEHGYVGLILYLALVFCSLRTAGRVLRQAQMRHDPVVANYARMFQFSLVGFLTSGLFLGRAYFDYFFTILACITILARVVYHEWAQEAEEAEFGLTEPDDYNMPLLENGGPAWRS
jgi:putative inorganic carbon (hco3(-)) transporter